jgi:hypothetical protein
MTESALTEALEWAESSDDARARLLAEKVRQQTAVLDLLRDELRCVRTTQGTAVWMDLRGSVFARILGVETSTNGDAE